ncbi:MAG: DUF2474 family protein [Roseobacter sp.]
MQGRGHRVIWFVVLWVCSVVTLGVVALIIKLAFGF